MADYELQDSEVGEATDHEELLQEIRDNFKNDLMAWADRRAESATDMRYIAGDNWDPAEKSSRTGPDSSRNQTQRLCLSFDELNQNVNQVVNNFLLNLPAVAVDPKGSGANDKTAEFRGDTIRQIEYRSNGTSAYAIAFKNAVQRSDGFFRITRDYESPETFNQELCLQAVPNSDSVIPDPNGTEPDGSDWNRCFVLKPYSHSEFRMEWPDAKIQSFAEDLTREFPDWMSAKTVQVAEYWKVKKTRRTLIALDRPLIVGSAPPKVEIILEDIPNGELVPLKSGRRIVAYELRVNGQLIANVTNRRPTITKRVCQYLTNGIEILEENEQPVELTWIPIVPIYGEELYIPSPTGPKRVYLSLVRLARDAQTAYSYVRTTQLEIIGQIPKAPYIGYAGQFAGYENEWLKVNKVPLPFLQAHAITEEAGDTVLPRPERTQFEPAVQALEVNAEALRRAIQSAMGVAPLPTAAMRRNEKSGVALKQIESSQQIGSYHFLANAKRSIAHGGRIMNALLKPTYDTNRLLGLRKADQSFEAQNTVQAVGEQQQPVNVFEVGEHEVTVSTGPSFDSQREAVENFVDTLVATPGLTEAAIQQPGSAAAKLLGLAIRLRNLGPLGDEMVDVLDPQQDGGPQSIQAQNQQMKAALQQAQQLIQQLKVEADKGRVEIEKANISAREGLERDQLNNKAKKEIQAQADRTAILVKLIDKGHEGNLAVLEAQVDKILTGMELTHEQTMQSVDHAHQANLQDSQQQAAMDQQQMAAQQPEQSA